MKGYLPLAELLKLAAKQLEALAGYTLSELSGTIELNLNKKSKELYYEMSMKKHSIAHRMVK